MVQLQVDISTVVQVVRYLVELCHPGLGEVVQRPALGWPGAAVVPAHGKPANHDDDYKDDDDNDDNNDDD